MRKSFVDSTRLEIDGSRESHVSSVIQVPDEAEVIDVDVIASIEHTYVDDLALILQGPDGRYTTLANSRGGSGDDYDRTIFDDEALTSIQNAPAPSRGAFQPLRPLSIFDGMAANGTWRLWVLDQAVGDGGALLGWALSLELGRTEGDYQIVVDFDGGLNARQREAFDRAARRWEQVITGALPEMRIGGGRTTNGVAISARGVPIDGAGRILGQAGPTFLRPGSRLPYLGQMEFDTADLAAMEADGTLENVIVHEMGHVLGLGTLWTSQLTGRGTSDPRHSGQNSVREWDSLGGTGFVPVANTGGPGTREGHWRESTFGHELMTGFISGPSQPLSRVTIAGLEDLGYNVDYGQAEPYALPSALELSMLGLDSSNARRCLACDVGRFPEPVVGPASDIV